MNISKERLTKVLKIVSQKLKDQKYAVRGTVSLVLQGLDMKVDDIDIICTKEVALKFNELFKEYLIDEVSFKESPKFKSYFGKFSILDVQVEVMGEWQIKKKDNAWSNVYDGEESILININDLSIPVTTVFQELSMFADMGRWTAFQKIKREAISLGIIQPNIKKESNVESRKKNIDIVSNQPSLFM